MIRYTKVLAASALACTAQVTLAVGSPGVERQTEGFLNALAAGGGKPLEQLSPADARAVLVGAQAGASFQSLKVDIAEKTINVAGHDIKLTVVRPAGAGGTVPVFMFFPALVLTAEKDVLRDEGEAYARKLDSAGVDVTAVRTTA